jgi:hypothetical protein
MGDYETPRRDPYENPRKSAEETSADVLHWLRMVGAGIGFFAILLGLIFALVLALSVYGGLKEPERFGTTIAKWEKTVGGRDLDVMIEGRAFPVARPLAVVIMGGGALLLIYVAMGAMFVGAKIVASTVTDREAIRKLLEHAFGPTRQARPRTNT